MLYNLKQVKLNQKDVKKRSELNQIRISISAMR